MSCCNKLCINDIIDIITTLQVVRPGVNGDDGEEGNVGENGARGRDGSTGGDGLNGIPGFPGEPGNPGPNGSNGNRGEDGSNGEKGLDGEKGPLGPQGPRGLRGDGFCLIFSELSPSSTYRRFFGKGQSSNTFFNVAYIVSQQLSLTRMKIFLFLTSLNGPNFGTVTVTLCRFSPSSSPISNPSESTTNLIGNITILSLEVRIYILTVSVETPVIINQDDLVAIRVTNSSSSFNPTTRITVSVD